MLLIDWLVICSLVYSVVSFFFFFFKQKTAYEMRISDWSSDVCSSDLRTRTTSASSASKYAVAQRSTPWTVWDRTDATRRGSWPRSVAWNPAHQDRKSVV